MGKEGWNGLRKGPAPLGEGAPRFHGFAKVLLVSFVTSLDALGVGIGLGVADKPIAPILVSIGLCAFASTMAGLMLARKLSSKFGPVMSLVGALILAVMSLQMLKI
jgi:putative Mn2+ efflux pump MntP